MAYQSHSSSKSRRLCINQTWVKQKGAVLIFIAFILGLGAAVYVLKTYNADAARARQDEKTYKALGLAKQALIAWSVSNSIHPGQMPFPDRNDDPEAYDGKSDCNSPISTFSYGFLLGQLPIYGQTNPCIAPQTGIASDLHDALGNNLWYAVSRNLVHRYEIDITNPNPVDPIINPSIIHNPVYPWLRVFDRNGVLISDRVAAVIIAPGGALDGQSRNSTANASEFLDALQIGATTYSNFNYSDAEPSGNFIIGQDSRTVTDADVTYVKPYRFNDKLIFITIDELVVALNNRAAAEASALLRQYQAKTGQFPYAANLGASLDNNISSPLSQKGMLPIDGTDTCGCSSYQSCTCNFKPITSVTFTKNSGTWATTTGACSISSSKCTCSDSGSCVRSAIYFSCDSAGNCGTNQTGVNLFAYTIPTYAKITQISMGCFLAGANIACNDAGSFSIGLNTATWFKTNLWQDYLYYEWSPTFSLQIGTKVGVGALLVSTGDVIANPPYASKGSSQSRPPTNPSPNLDDYLDSSENTDGNSVFDATSKQKSNNYNDQTYIVAP
jgi:hypothetical protein